MFCTQAFAWVSDKRFIVMQIKKIDEIKIEEIVDLLKKNKVVVVLTETAYGLLANALSEEAVKKVFEIKQRDVSKELSVFMRDLKMANDFVEVNEKAKELVEKYLPGPLTLVLKLKREMPFVRNTLGIRISSCDLIKKIMAEIDFPVTATSANLAGEKACYSLDDVVKQFGDKQFKPDLVIDGGKLEEGRISTVVDLSESNIKILRQGVVKLENLESGI